MDDSFATGYALGSDSNGNRNDGGMMGGEGFLFLIVILALMGGNGGGLFGGNRNDGNCATKTDLCEGFNFNDLQRGVSQLGQGICDSTFALNTSIMNGFHGVDNGLCNIGHQIATCCCDQLRASDQVRFDMSRGFCDVIQAGHNDADRIIGFLTNDKIEALRDRAMAAEAQLSQNAQSRYIVDTVRPCPIPAFPSCNPWAYNTNNCGCGCGV